MRPIATDEVAWSVCRSVCLSVGYVREPCKTALNAVWMPGWGPDPPRERGQFWGWCGPLKSAVNHCCGLRCKKSIKASARLMQPTA